LFQYKTNNCFKLKHLQHLPNEKPTLFASTIKNRTSQHTTKVFNRACKANPKEKLFLKNFQRFKNNKIPDTQARQKSNRQMTVTDDIKMVVTHDRQERQPIIAPTKNWRLSASYDSFVVEQTFVLCMNIFGKNRQLLVAAKRWQQVKT
jgi:hypothetical protein